MRSLLLVVLLLVVKNICIGQEFSKFTWKDEKVSFSAVEMKVVDDKTEKQIFQGYKDSHIDIEPFGDRPLLTSISLKLSGYFQIENGTVSNFQLKEDEKWLSVGYTVTSGVKMCLVLINYRSGETKPAFIIVSTNDDFMNKASKQLTFTIKGFE